MATGRTPNVKGLGLEELGLDIDPAAGAGDDRGATTPLALAAGTHPGCSWREPDGRGRGS